MPFTSDSGVLDHTKYPNYGRNICEFYSHALRGVLDIN